MSTNKQVNRSKKWMYRSLMDLLEKTPFSEISISNIVEKADVARLTFYRNFKSKEDIVIYKGNEILQTVTKKIDKEKFISKEVAYQIFTDEFMRNSKFFFMVCKNDLDYILMKSFKQDLENLFGRIFPDINPIKRTFYVGGFSTVVFDWYRGYHKEDRLYNILMDLI